MEVNLPSSSGNGKICRFPLDDGDSHEAERQNMPLSQDSVENQLDPAFHLFREKERRSQATDASAR